MEDFADAYLRGETPIPCVRWNQTVKFRDLLDVARDLGAEAMATAHYVRRAGAAPGALPAPPPTTWPGPGPPSWSRRRPSSWPPCAPRWPACRSPPCAPPPPIW